MLEIFRAKSGLDRRQPLLEDAEISRSDGELRLAWRARLPAAKARKPGSAALPQSLTRAGIGASALERRPAAAHKAHDKFEQQKQKADLEEQAKDRHAAAKAAKQPIPEQHAKQTGPDEATDQAAAETTRKEAARGATEYICIGRGHRPLHGRGPRRRGRGGRRAKGASATAAKRKAAARAGRSIAGKAQRKRRCKGQNQGFVAKRHGFILADSARAPHARPGYMGVNGQNTKFVRPRKPAGHEP